MCLIYTISIETFILCLEKCFKKEEKKETFGIGDLHNIILTSKARCYLLCANCHQTKVA